MCVYACVGMHLRCCFFLGLLFTGELWEFLRFAERFPAVIYNILLFGLSSALGQVSCFLGTGWLVWLGEGGWKGLTQVDERQLGPCSVPRASSS